MKPAIAYLRISKDPDEKSESPAAQEQKIRQWAALYDYEIVDVLLDDGISGHTTRKRTGVQQAIDRACLKHCPLVFYSQSRLIRNTEEAIQIERRMRAAGADMVSVTERIDTSTVDGWFMFILRALLDEREILLVGERTKNVLSYKKKNGDAAGPPPYGYQQDKTRPEINRKSQKPYYPHLIPNPTEQAIIAQMRDLRTQGLTYQAIADTLNEQGTPSKSGKTWYPSSVHTILTASK